MKKLLLLLILCLPIVLADTPSLNWNYTFSPAVAYAVATDSSNNVISAGGNYSLDPTYGDFQIVKLDSNGNFLCQNTISGAGSTTRRAYGVDVDSSNNILATGSFYSGGDVWFTAKYNTTCGQIWNVSAPGSAWIGYALTVDNSDNVIVAGQNNSQRPTIIKYNSSGNHQYNNSVAIQGDFYGVTADSQNEIIATGWNGNADLIVYKYNTTLGLIWSRLYNYSQTTWNFGKSDVGRDVETDSSDNVYIVGIFNTSWNGHTPTRDATQRIVVIKFDSSGNWIWNNTYDSTNTSAHGAGGMGIAIDSADRIYITGYEQGGTNWRYVTHRLNSDGTINWSITYPLAAVTNSPYGADTSPSGAISVAGVGSSVVLNYNNDEPPVTGTVPEFSTYALLLAVLLTGGLIFAIRKYR